MFTMGDVGAVAYSGTVLEPFLRHAVAGWVYPSLKCDLWLHKPDPEADGHGVLE